MPKAGNSTDLRLPVWGIFILSVLVTATLAKAFMLPIVLSVLIALTLSPVVRSLRRRGVPESLSAGVLVLLGTVLFTLMTAFVAEPFSEWIERFPRQLAEVRFKLRGVLEKVSAIQSATSGGGAVASANERDALTSDGAEIVTMAATNLLAVATTLFVTTILTFFLLSKGRVFYARILEQFSTLQGKKETLATVYTIERSISRYLFTITIINILLGVAIAAAMWLLGMSNPVLWGIAATTLNFLPYIGAIMGIVGSGIVAILTFEPLGSAMAVPFVYALLTGLEGQLITPTFVGRNLAINPVVIFFAVAMWTFMWGLAGALIAVPLLVVVHTIALNVEQLSWLAAFISAEDEPE